MANNITVTPATVKTKANELKSQNAKLKTYISSLTSTENSLNSMWDGEANDAFHRAFTSDVKQMTNFYNLIEKYIVALNQIAESYEKAERANTSTANTRKYR